MQKGKGFAKQMVGVQRENMNLSPNLPHTKNIFKTIDRMNEQNYKVYTGKHG